MLFIDNKDSGFWSLIEMGVGHTRQLVVSGRAFFVTALSKKQNGATIRYTMILMKLTN